MKELPIHDVVPTNDNFSGASTETNYVENEKSNHMYDDFKCILLIEMMT